MAEDEFTWAVVRKGKDKDGPYTIIVDVRADAPKVLQDCAGKRLRGKEGVEKLNEVAKALFLYG